MADEATSQRESWWVLQAQSGSHEALNELFKSLQEPLFLVGNLSPASRAVVVLFYLHEMSLARNRGVARLRKAIELQQS